MEVRLLIEEFRGEVDTALDSYEILTKAERLLRDLVRKEDWTTLQRHIDPVIYTHTGKRDYPLPDDFGSNFVRGSVTDGRTAPPLYNYYMCKLSDGTGESTLEYKPPGNFFSVDFEAASNATPTYYTVVTDGEGYKQLWLDPPPDSNSDSHYTIRGVYQPSFANLTLDSWVPEEVSSYLLYGLLQRVQPENPSHQRDFLLARQSLYLEEARIRNSRLQSQEGFLPGHDGWAAEFQR